MSERVARMHVEDCGCLDAGKIDGPVIVDPRCAALDGGPDAPPSASTDELITWLRAQLDEDERVARGAIADDLGQDGGFEDASWLDDPESRLTKFGRPAAAMIRRFAVPRRVLAEVEAKRRVLDEIADEATGLDMSVDNDRRVGSRDMEAEPHLGDQLVRLLAQPYAGRSGWREAWRA